MTNRAGLTERKGMDPAQRSDAAGARDDNALGCVPSDTPNLSPSLFIDGTRGDDHGDRFW
jgi:hypothetical protein